MAFSICSHCADLDGVASALLAYHHIKTTYLLETPQVPVNFTSISVGAEENIIKAVQGAKELWITDLSFSNPEFLVNLVKFHPSVKFMIFDHHASSTEAFSLVSGKENVNVFFDATGNKCAADLVMDYISKRMGVIPEPLHDLTSYTHSIDLWIRNYPQGELLSSVVSVMGAEATFKELSKDYTRVYQSNFTPAMSLCVKKSEEDYLKSENLAMETFVQENYTFNKNLTPFVKTAFCFGGCSKIGDKLLEGKLGWIGLIDLSRQELSFRTNNETVKQTGVGAHDIAKLLGGGGHPNAAGARGTKDLIVNGPQALKKEMMQIVSKIDKKRAAETPL